MTDRDKTNAARHSSAKNPYAIGLAKNAANFQPLTPLTFLQRAAEVFPRRAAIVHGGLRRDYGEFYARSRRLASALAARGIGRDDTVSVMLANTPAMLECHYGVPMLGAVLNTLNTRLDSKILAFTLDHAEAKALIVDREFAPVMREALSQAKVKPLIIDYDDPEYQGPGERIGTIEYEELVASGDPGFRLVGAARRMGRDFAELHLRHDGQSQGRGLPPSGRGAPGARECPCLEHGEASGLSVDAADVPLQRLVLSLVDLGRRRHACVPAPGARRADL